MENKILMAQEDAIIELQRMESFMIVISKIIERKHIMINRLYY